MIPVYQVDAFANKRFSGNPAAVCPLAGWLSDEELQNIASEINLSETAFIVRNENGYHLRWFTPLTEVRLCGHATLASAHVVFNHLNYNEDQIVFSTEQVGNLTVSKSGDNYIMDFPADKCNYFDKDELIKTVDCPILEAYKGSDDILIITDNELSVSDCQPNLSVIKQLSCRALIVSSEGKDQDFVSRVFAPSCGIDEDPVTGSAHTLMTPYWSNKLSKNKLYAAQISKRRGELVCELKGDRVLLTGSA